MSAPVFPREVTRYTASGCLICSGRAMRNHIAIKYYISKRDNPPASVLTLLLGLDFKAFAGNQIAGTIAAWDLILGALLAWYLLAHVTLVDSDVNPPVGKLWIK